MSYGIPTAPISLVLTEFRVRYGEDRERDAWELLAERMGYSDARSAQSSIERVLSHEHLTERRYGFDPFDWLDRLLVALDMPHLWAELVGGDEDEDERDLETAAEHDDTCADCGRALDWDDDTELAVRIELGRLVHVRRRWSWWSLCALCWAKGSPRPRIPDAAGKVRERRIPDEILLDLYLAYAGQKVGLEFLVEKARVVERFDFTTTRAAASSITAAWRGWGWPMFCRSASKRLNRLARVSAGQVGGRVPADDLRRLHVLHTRGEKLSALELSRRLHVKYGYRTPTSMHRCILDGWKALGLKARDRIEMTVEMSTTNGLSPRNWQERKRRRAEAGLTQKGKQRKPDCLGTTKRGRCTRPATLSGYCFSHDPAREEERDAITARMRERSPLQNQPMLTPEQWEPLRQELLAARELLGSWEPLAEELGLKWRSVWKYATDPHMRVSELRGTRIRAAIFTVSPPVELAEAA